VPRVGSQVDWDLANRKFTSASDKHIAYILVKCKLDLEKRVVNSLKKVDGVAEVEQVFGSPYDIIVKVVYYTPAKLSTAVWRIRRIARIISTQTLLVSSFSE
jgi:DNA-binding Lrp family transcriptional regulator